MKPLSSPAIWSLVLLAGLTQDALPARETTVATPLQLNATLAAAQPGDVVILKNGAWANASIQVGRGGGPGEPVSVRAESPGGVVLGGVSSLEINAPHVTVEGLLFHKGTTRKDAVIRFNSHHGIVRNCAVVDYNPAAFGTKYYWVFFSGNSNVVDRCFFKGKRHLEPLIGNRQEGSRHNAVLRSYFKDIPLANGNGREILRIWGSGRYVEAADDGAFFTIADNLFERADGEGAEIISLKSNHNLVRRNTIIATRGCVNIRRGDFNVIEGNIILGRGVNGAKGFRMTGEHNLVRSNYVSGCEYGMELSCGEYIAHSLTARYDPDTRAAERAQRRVPSRPQNRDVTIADNVLVGNTGADLVVGGSYKRNWPVQQEVLIPEACLIKNNRLVRPRGGASVVGTIPDTRPPLNQFQFEPNQYTGNVLVGGVNAFAPAAGGCRPQGIPPGWSEAQERASFKPLTAADVGPDWVRARGW